MFDRLARRVGVSVVLLLVGLAGGWWLRAQSAAPAGAQTPEPASGEKLGRLVHDEVQKQLFELRPASLQAEENAKLASLASTLQTVRAQFELYCIMHEDHRPTLAQLDGWRVMVEATKVDGSTGGRGDFGPYLQHPPANPITGKSAAAPPGKATVNVGWTYDADTGALRAVAPESWRGRVEQSLLRPDDVEYIGG